MDDGSTDGTPLLCAGFSDPRFRYIRQANAGLSAARNTGILEAKSSLIAFLDADDAWEPEFLHRTLEYFSKLEPQYGAIATAASRMNRDGDVIPEAGFTFGRNGELNVRDFCLRNRPLSSNIIVRKQVFEECGAFDTELRSSEDRDMWIRLTSAGWRFYFVDEPLARIRRHSSNMSRNAPRMKMNSRLVLAKARAAKAVPRWSPFWLKVMSIHYYQAALTHFDGHYRIRAFVFLLYSVLLWPCFLDPSQISERYLFRARTLARFTLNILISLK